MKQLSLALEMQPPQTLDSFVSGRNLELLSQLRQFANKAGANGADVQIADRTLYCWGPHGSGKSHLLHALAASDNAVLLSGRSPASKLVYSSSTLLYLIDDCDQLSPEAQIAAFGLFNQIKDNQGLLVAAGQTAPAALSLREDLRTRLGWSLIYQIHGLSDQEKIAALQQNANARGMMISPGVLPYLLSHFDRDMRSLLAMLDALDRHSLDTKRPITLPLLRDLVQTEIKA